MINFLICGIAFLLFAFVKFKKKRILYPSVVFSVMWSAVCLYTAAILNGFGENLNLKECYHYEYMDTLIVYVTIATIGGFMLAHAQKISGPRLMISEPFMDILLSKYGWVMWLNFWGGILRMVLMIRLVGLDNMMDYRLAANVMMMTSSFTLEGLVFKLTAYIQMFANFYVGLYGLRTGLNTLNLKRTLVIFMLYAPTQMATGGRLFILYFILFFFGSFLLGRGLKLKGMRSKLLLASERKILIFSFVGLLGLVGFIAMLRGGGVSEDKETTIEKLAYITEGVLATEHMIQYHPPGTYALDWGENTLGSSSANYLSYRGYLESTKMSSIIVCIFTPFYLDFGYWGLVVAMFLVAFGLEYISLRTLRRMTLLNFFVLLLILKMLYESVLSTSLSTNIPQYELLILFYFFYKGIFGKYEKQVACS